ncbi:MAG: hypothetical protein QM770_14315 [Tepidisphaeraceae bacterium]
MMVYLPGRVWNLRYHELGQRRQVRATVDRQATRQLAVDVNAQLESGAPAVTSYEQVSIDELRERSQATSFAAHLRRVE